MLDQNSDNILDKFEYRDLRKVVRKVVKPKKCARQFPRTCDVNKDGRISIQEWTDCLTRDGRMDMDGKLRIKYLKLSVDVNLNDFIRFLYIYFLN